MISFILQQREGSYGRSRLSLVIILVCSRAAPKEGGLLALLCQAIREV